MMIVFYLTKVINSIFLKSMNNQLEQQNSEKKKTQYTYYMSGVPKLDQQYYTFNKCEYIVSHMEKIYNSLKTSLPDTAIFYGGFLIYYQENIRKLSISNLVKHESSLSVEFQEQSITLNIQYTAGFTASKNKFDKDNGGWLYGQKGFVDLNWDQYEKELFAYVCVLKQQKKQEKTKKLFLYLFISIFSFCVFYFLINNSKKNNKIS